MVPFLWGKRLIARLVLQDTIVLTWAQVHQLSVGMHSIPGVELLRAVSALVD